MSKSQRSFAMHVPVCQIAAATIVAALGSASKVNSRQRSERSHGLSFSDLRTMFLGSFFKLLGSLKKWVTPPMMTWPSWSACWFA